MDFNITDYNLQKFRIKQVADSVHGVDVLYDSAYNIVKNAVAEQISKNAIEQEMLKEMLDVFDSIEDVKQSNVSDKEKIELYLRRYIAELIEQAKED